MKNVLKELLESVCLRLVYSLVWTGLTSLFSITIIVIAASYPLFWPFLLFYSMWLWYDWDTPSKGGRPFKYCFVKRWRIFNIIRDYFPITLVKTTELDSNKNYILGYHPHGMLPDGALVCFGSEAAGFGQLFPGLMSRVAMHSVFGWFPGFREFAMAAGMISVSRDSLEYVLTNEGSGQCVVTLIGGSSEVLYTSPSWYQLVLNRRKGFVKLALKTGSSLVPVFAFGQNDMFHQPPSALPSRLENKVNLSKWAQVFIKYSLLAFRDVETFGVMPRRKPITVVVGAPIDVQKRDDPTPEQINYLHSLYVQELKDLFDKHKMKYNDPKDVHLILDEM
ncbi:2-acylglycerol O-acyltransferase 2-like [Actinia tenebrosa]|uniref:Acyltransferase n=1 Tax=Actinia tenebrosa TaxID=6105 RepID=A0A6P8IPV3_ACTTE|nr:2-acylglycerol O-acyltransferase 2-like [Actinia tenebrosa]